MRREDLGNSNTAIRLVGSLSVIVDKDITAEFEK